MKIPDAVREAMGSPAPNVPFQLKPVHEVAARTGMSRADYLTLFTGGLDTGLVRKTGDNEWVLGPDEPDEPLPFWLREEDEEPDADTEDA